MSFTPHLALWAAALAATVAPGAGAESAQVEATDPVAPSQLASRFADLLLRGDVSELGDICDDTMKAALTPEIASQMRAQLVQQYGAVESLNEPWQETNAEGSLRFRVPVQFERKKIDLRVVVTGANRESSVAGVFIVPHAPAPSESTAAVPGAERDVQVGSGPPLPGTLLIPPGEGPFPGVVLVHGSGPNDRDVTIGPNRIFRDVAYGLAQRGIASLRYDKRSFAAAESLAAHGASLTAEHEAILDARAATALLGSTPEIDPKQVFVLGHSLGGTLAPRIPDDSTPVAGIVVLAGATRHLPEMVMEQTQYIFDLQKGALSVAERAAGQAQVDAVISQMRQLRSALSGSIEATDEFVMGAPIGYYRDLENHPPAKLLAAAKRRVLVLQGTRDFQVTLEDFAGFERELRDAPFACLELYEGLDHLFHTGEGPSRPEDYEKVASVSEEVLADIADWILAGQCPSSD